MSAPLFSVCLLTYNNADFIAAAIESVLAQSLLDWELLISDDASTDDTPAKVAPFLADPRIRYVRHEENLRQAANWTYAMEHTSARFIAVLHADDVWQPDTLARFAEGFRSDETIDLVWASWLRVDTALEPLAHQPDEEPARTFTGPDILRTVFKTNCVLPSAAAVRRDVLTQSGMPEAEYGMLCDREWWLRVAAASRKAQSLSARVTLYRIHDKSVTTIFTRNGKLAAEMDDFRLRLPRLLQSLPEADRAIREYDHTLAEFFFRVAIGERIAGQPRAGAHMHTALAARPGLLLRPRFSLKWILFHAGPLGRRLLERVHGQNRWVLSPTTGE